MGKYFKLVKTFSTSVEEHGKLIFLILIFINMFIKIEKNIKRNDWKKKNCEISLGVFSPLICWYNVICVIPK